MNNKNVVWISTIRAERMITVPAELKDVVMNNWCSVANVNDPNYGERNNGVFRTYGLYETANAPEKKLDIPVKFLAAYTSTTSLKKEAQDSLVTFANKTPMILLPNIKSYKVGDKTYATQLDPEFIKFMGDILDMESILGNEITCGTHLDGFDFKSGSNIDITKAVFNEDRAWTDAVGTIAILSDDLADAFKTKFGTTDINVLKTASLYKGATPYFSLDQQSIQNIASGGRFFLYSTNIKTYDNLTDAQVLTPFIGLAVFGADKMIKYKNALTILERLQGFTDNLKTQAILNPERYKEIVKQMVAPVAEYWPGLATILGKAGDEGKGLTLLDTNTIKGDDPNKFKAFFINTTLQRTPEASRYLAMKGKAAAIEKQNKELKVKLEMLQKTIEDRRAKILANIEEVRLLEASIRESKETLEQSSVEIITVTPQVERASNAVVEIASQLQPLETDYNTAIGKYWEQEADLEVLKAWESEGFLIKDIQLTNISTGTHLTSPADIRKAMTTGSPKNLRISSMSVWTTQPSVILKDAHRKEIGFEKATRYAGGPYQLKIIFDGYSCSMSARLLDDRSLRATWSDNGYRYFSMHPHIEKWYVRDGDFTANKAGQWAVSTQKWQNCCLGELAPILQKGMTDLNLQSMVYGLKAWLTTADSNDAWGATVTKFPLEKDVTITKFVSTKVQESRSIEEVTPVYGRQLTFLKKDNDIYLAKIYLTEDTKIISHIAAGEVKDGNITLLVAEKSTLFFMTNAQKETAMAENKTKLEEDGYFLYAESKSINEIKLSYTYTDGKALPVEDYKPSAKRITEQIIAELQALVEGRTPAAR